MPDSAANDFAISGRLRTDAALSRPAGEVPALDVPALDVPAQEVPAQVVPAQDVPAQDVPAQDVPARSTLSQHDVLLIGNVESPRFEPVLRELPFNKFWLCENSTCRSVRVAIERLDARHESPQLVLVSQSYPDEHPRDDVEQLIGRLPLSRFVVAYGPWCESIGRTEQVWPIGWCVPLNHASVRVQRELALMAGNCPPMPATTSRDEAFRASVSAAFDSAGNVRIRSGTGRQFTARVSGTDREFVACIRETLTTIGLQVASAADSQTSANTGFAPDFDVIAVSLADEWAINAIAQRRSESPAACLIVSSDLAPEEDVVSLLNAGADHVIGQLRFAEEFATIVRRTTRQLADQE